MLYSRSSNAHSRCGRSCSLFDPPIRAEPQQATLILDPPMTPRVRGCHVQACFGAGGPCWHRPAQDALFRFYPAETSTAQERTAIPFCRLNDSSHAYLASWEQPGGRPCLPKSKSIKGRHHHPPFSHFACISSSTLGAISSLRRSCRVCRGSSTEVLS